MKHIKIVFFDIDGTLIDINTRSITDRTLTMLRDLQHSGIRICIATGRAPVQIPSFSRVIFDAYLTFNGSYCYTGDKTIFSRPIPEEDVRQIIRNATALGRPVCAARKDRFAANGLDQDLVDYYSISRQTLTVEPDFNNFIRQDVYQIMMGCRKKDYPRILDGVQGARIEAWWDRAVDIIPRASGKGTGVRKILDFFHYDKSDAMAFGDGDNDIEMLKTVGHGIAMGNGSEEVKAAAEEVCGNCAEDGIYHYFREIGLL